MGDREIIFADISTPERREDYVRNSAQIPDNLHGNPQIQQIISETPAEPQLLPSCEEPRRAPSRGRARRSEALKRQYSFVNQRQRDRLTELFKQHGTNRNAVWYHTQTGINLGRCRNFLTKLRKGQDITLSTIKRGRRRSLQRDHSDLIYRIVQERPEITLKDLVKKVTKYEHTKLMREGGASDAAGAENHSESYDHEPEGNGDAFDDDENEDGSEAHEERDGYTSDESTDIEPQEFPGQGSTSQADEREEELHPICSVATMSRHLVEGITLHGFEPLTYKIMCLRSPCGNTPELKNEWKLIASIILNLHQKGAEIAFVDETHWEVGQRVQRGRSPKGEKALSTRCFQRTKLTSISMISSIGHTFNQVLKGKVTAEVFESYMCDLISWYSGKSKNSMVFYMDNAPVHNHERLVQVIRGAGHEVVFGPRYSPEMNLIEFIFGKWKKELMIAIRSLDITETVLKREIKNSFDKLSPMLFRRTVNHVFMKVYPKVFSGCDL